MIKKLNRIVEIPCEESDKMEIKARIHNYLVDNEDYKNGNIVLRAERFEAVDVIFYEGCSNISEIIKVLSF
jgi:hypothetical protein